MWPGRNEFRDPNRAPHIRSLGCRLKAHHPSSTPPGERRRSPPPPPSFRFFPPRSTSNYSNYLSGKCAVFAIFSSQDGTSGMDTIAAVAFGANDSVVLAGRTTGGFDGASAGGGDLVVVKLDPEGRELWRYQVGPAAFLTYFAFEQAAPGGRGASHTPPPPLRPRLRAGTKSAYVCTFVSCCRVACV